MKMLVAAIALLSCTAMALDTVQKKTEPAKAPQKQEAPAVTSPAKDPATASTEKPKPSAEMKKLARMIGGRWQVEEKYEVTQFTPQGGEGKGTNVVHRGPGGLSLISTYNSTSPLGDYSGTGITTWSPENNTYQQFWVDSGAAGGELWTGNWEGDSLVFTTSQKMGDKTIQWKETFSSFTNDGYSVTFDWGPSVSELKRFMTFKFTRMAKQQAGVHRHGMGMHARPNTDGGWGPRADSTLR